VAQPG